MVFADEPQGGTGAPETASPGLTPREQAEADAKAQLADDYLLFKAGKLDHATFATTAGYIW